MPLCATREREEEEEEEPETEPEPEHRQIKRMGERLGFKSY